MIQDIRKTRVDSLPGFPRSAVHPNTEAFLISVFEMGTDEPRPSGRPNSSQEGLFIKILLNS